MDHVYQQGTEQDVLERSLQPLIKACVEGVNVALLAIGSSQSCKSDLLFSKMDQQSLVITVFNTIWTSLETKAMSMNSFLPGNGTNRSRTSLEFSLCISFIEFYEETIQVGPF